jgi:urease accessory protein UreE
MVGNEQINTKLLTGLKFKTSEGRKTDEPDGRKKVRHFPVERPLKPDDVLDWKDLGASVVIVAKDGQKHTVDKEVAAEPKGKAKGGDGGAA